MIFGKGIDRQSEIVLYLFYICLKSLYWQKMTIVL
jgi:hypothetical protein